MPRLQDTSKTASTHEVEFLYKRIAELQKAFDEILRLPYINEAEVSDIIGKVYQSAATRVSYKQLQKVNPYKIESPREPERRDKLPKVR